MPLILNSQKKRFELTDSTGRVLAVMPLPGGDVSDVDPRLVGTPTPTMLQNGEKYLQGDEAAGDALEDELDGYNTVLAPQPQQRQTQGQGGMLPTPAYLAAGVDIMRSAIDARDFQERLDIRQRELDRAYQKLGITIDWQSLLANPEAGKVGPFVTDERAIAEAAATDPDYLRVFGGIQNLAIVSELNRRQNILAEYENRLQGTGEQKAKNRSADQLQARLATFDRDVQRAVQKYIATTGTPSQSQINQMWLDAEYEREGLLNELWTSMYEANPARAVAYFRDIVPGLTHQQPSIAVGKEIDPVRTYGGRDVFGNVVGKDGPETGNQPKLTADQRFTPPSLTTPAVQDQPPGPAPAGHKWVKERDSWVLREVKDYEPQEPPEGYAQGGMVPGQRQAFSGVGLDVTAQSAPSFRAPTPTGVGMTIAQGAAGAARDALAGSPPPIAAGLGGKPPEESGSTPQGQAQAALHAQLEQLRADLDRQLAVIGQEKSTRLSQIQAQLAADLRALQVDEDAAKQNFTNAQAALAERHGARMAELRSRLPGMQRAQWRERGLIPMPVGG